MMAKSSQKTKTSQEYESEYKKDYEEDWDIHKNYIQTFDAYEAMLTGQVYDTVSNTVDGSKITDSYAMTLAKEQADRVIAKLPEGATESAGKADVGKAAFMDILRQKWIYPNANAQYPLLEKINMWQLYSSVYGYMPMFYDWNVAPSGYVGPDCWLWNPRNLVPQQGRISIQDMDYVTALTWVSKKFLEGIRDKYKGEKNTEGWDIDAVEALITKASDSTQQDNYKDSLVNRNRVTQAIKKGVCLATRYEAGDDGNWCTFAPDHSFIQIREIPNPHKNGRIPFVIKYSQPLFDNFYALGDFQRAKPLQFARDGLTNFYFQGIKMNLIPPLVANANGVVKHTLDYRPGGVMLETIPNSIRRLETSPAGLATYQGAQSNLTGSLLSLFGTQNASIPGSDTLNPTQGRTPAAINMYSDKEATRDGAERRHVESALELLHDGWFSLIANIGTEEIPVTLFADDIKDIQEAGLTDIGGLFTNFRPDTSGRAGNLKINPSALKGVEYRFNINPNSTAKENKQTELDGLERIMGAIGKFQNIFKDDPRIKVNWPKIMETYENLSNLKGASDFITVTDGPDPQEAQLMQQNQELQKQVQQMQMDAEKHQQQMQMDAEKHQQQLQQNDQNQQLDAAKAQQGMVQSDQQHAAAMQPEPQAPNVNAGGLFKDPELAAVAEQITKL